MEIVLQQPNLDYALVRGGVPRLRRSLPAGKCGPPVRAPVNLTGGAPVLKAVVPRPEGLKAYLSPRSDSGRGRG